MRGPMRLAVRLVLIYLMILSLAWSLSYTEKLASMRSITMLYLNSPLTTGQLLKLQNDESKQDFPLDVSGWFQKDEQELHNPEFNRNIKANVVYFLGNSSLLMDSTASIPAEDLKGALISEDLAFDLFGSLNVTGFTFTVEEREFTVRGLLTDGTDTALLPAVVEMKKDAVDETKNKDSTKSENKNKTETKNNNDKADLIKVLAVDTSGLESKEREQAVNQFTERHQLSAESVNFDKVKNLAGLFSAFLLLAVTVAVFVGFVKRAKAARGKPILFIIISTGAVLSLIAAFFISSADPSIPQGLIPNRWSDFEFWQRTGNAFFEDNILLFNILKEEPESRYFEPLMKALGSSLLAVLFFLLSITGLKLDSGLKCFGWVAASLVLEYLVIMTVNDYGVIPSNIGMIWLLYPYFLIGKYITK